MAEPTARLLLQLAKHFGNCFRSGLITYLVDSPGIMGVMALLSVPQAAAQYGLSRTHIRRLVSAGVLKGQKIGNSWAVNEASVRAYLATERKRGRRPKNKTKRGVDK